MAAPAYTAYLGNANPTPYNSGVNYYSYSYGDVAFFVWDTRRYRSSNEAIDDQDKTMLGLEQKEVFLDWLKEVNGTHTFKFVVSSVPFQTCYGGPNGKYDSKPNTNSFQPAVTSLLISCQLPLSSHFEILPLPSVAWGGFQTERSE